MNLQVLKWLIGCKNADMQLGFLLEIDFFVFYKQWKEFSN